MCDIKEIHNKIEKLLFNLICFQYIECKGTCTYEYRVNKQHATKSKHMIQSIDYSITQNLCLSQRNATCSSILCINKVKNILNSE